MDFSWIKDLIPIISGFTGLLLGHWLTNRSKSRESLDAWWERYAITEGIEPVITYLTTVQERMTAHVGYGSIPEKPTFPLTANLHILAITRIAELGPLMKFSDLVAEHGAPPKNLLEFNDTLAQVTTHLIALQGILLDIKINKKSDILLVSQQPLIRGAAAAIAKTIGEMKPLPDTNIPDVIRERMRQVQEAQPKSA